MRRTVTQLARESVGLCPLSWFVREGIRVITLSSKQDYKNNSHNLHVKMLQWTFYNLYVK